jgi:hypothetical protein
MTAHRLATRWRTPLGIAGLVLLGAGCQPGDSPVAPDAQRCPSAPVPLCADAIQAAAVRAAVGDAQLRLVPALGVASTRDMLAHRLTVVAAALGDGDVSVARTALAAARGGVAEARGQLSAHPADAADLSAIELTFDQVAAVLGGS